jgi:hypothetical protein
VYTRVSLLGKGSIKVIPPFIARQKHGNPLSRGSEYTEQTNCWTRVSVGLSLYPQIAV